MAATDRELLFQTAMGDPAALGLADVSHQHLIDGQRSSLFNKFSVNTISLPLPKIAVGNALLLHIRLHRFPDGF